MTLQRAVSTMSDLTILDADGPYYEVLFDRIFDSLGHVSDMVEAGGLGEAYVRLDGLERLYGGESGAVSALMDVVSDHLNPRVGVAYAKFPAYATARTAEPMSVVRAPDDVSAFLAPMSIDLLPVSAELKSALHRFGLRLLGDVASIGRRAMFDRFGRGARLPGNYPREWTSGRSSPEESRSPSSSTLRCRSPPPRWRWCAWVWTCCSCARSQDPL